MTRSKRSRGRGDVGAGGGVGEHLQRPRQQVVLDGERGLGAGEREGARDAFAAAQQQGKGDGLGVGVGKLVVGSVGEQELPPVARQLHEGRGRAFEGIGHVVPQHAAQRRQHGGKAFEINFARAAGGDERLPQEKIAQQVFDGVRIVRRGGFVAVGSDVARQTNDPVHGPAVPVERPFVAVGVEEVRDGGEALELVAVAALEAAGGDANAGRLELDVSGQQLVEVDGVIQAPEAVGQGRLARADDVPAQRLGGRGHEGFERGA